MKDISSYYLALEKNRPLMCGVGGVPNGVKKGYYGNFQIILRKVGSNKHFLTNKVGLVSEAFHELNLLLNKDLPTHSFSGCSTLLI